MNLAPVQSLGNLRKIIQRGSSATEVVKHVNFKQIAYSGSSSFAISIP